MWPLLVILGGAILATGIALAADSQNRIPPVARVLIALFAWLWLSAPVLMGLIAVYNLLS